MKTRKEFGKISARIFYEFATFRVDARERQVRRDGKLLALTPKVFDILLLLIQNPGRILTKDEMMKQVWPDTTVEEANLPRNISTLRKALGEERDEYIETIPWRGYRFVAEVKELRDGSDQIDSLAVLPFVNESADPAAEYLSDGITEDLIHKLSLLSSLKVMSRLSVFHYKVGDPKKSQADAKEVGRVLGVRAVLTGRIRVIENVVLVSVELVDAGDNAHLWGAQYNRELSDISKMQESISREVVQQLKVKLTAQEQQRLAQSHAEDPEAYQLYLKGRYFWNKLTPDGIRKAIQFFEQAIGRDPAYALAYTGLLDCHTYLNQPVQARRAAAQALELDPALGEVHASLGFFKFLYDWDFPGTEKELKQALKLSPNYAQTHHWHAIYVAHMGRFEEAIAEAARARELDPLSPLINQTMGNVLMLAGDYDGAVDALLHTLELDPHFAAAHSVLACVYCLKGMYEEALARFEKVGSLAGGNAAIDASVQVLSGWVYAAWGKKSEAMKIIAQNSESPMVSPYSIAGIYAALGEHDRAFEYLNRAFQARSFQLVSLKVDPSFRNLRSDPRFEDLLHRIGLKP